MGNKQRGTLLDLLPEFIFGAEGEGEGEGSEGSEGAGGAEGSEEEQEEQEEQKDETDVAGLKSALDRERKAAKAAQKRATALEKEKAERDLAEASDLEKANAKVKTAEDKAAKLAEGLLTRDLNAAITKAAEKLKFIDVDDVINSIDRTKLTFEQDEDDPSDIDIDLKSVETQVKALSVSKPHWIRSGTDDGEATGSGFGGSKKKKVDGDAALKELYPSLSR